jgi:hypothetical protein
MILGFTEINATLCGKFILTKRGITNGYTSISG